MIFWIEARYCPFTMRGLVPEKYDYKWNTVDTLSVLIATDSVWLEKHWFSTWHNNRIFYFCARCELRIITFQITHLCCTACACSCLGEGCIFSCWHPVQRRWRQVWNRAQDWRPKGWDCWSRMEPLPTADTWSQTHTCTFIHALSKNTEWQIL